MQGADALVRLHKLPGHLGNRIRDYYDFVADENIIEQDQRLIAGLSLELYQDFLLYNYGGLLRRVPFFSSKSNRFVLEIVQVLSMMVVPPEEVALEQGTISTCIRFILSGEVDVVWSKDPEKLFDKLLEVRMETLETRNRRFSLGENLIRASTVRLPSLSNPASERRHGRHVHCP